MARIPSLSGFPEWLPEQELLQQRMLAHLREQFERHGFQALTTRSVEPLSVLDSKGGDTDKEIYVLRRLHADPESEGDSGLALHFDLTVPFARYVAEHRGDLVFPWKRYQIQPVWRGERPQQGRYREFVQADIDVIGLESLPLRFDGEVIRLLGATLATLPIPSVVLQVNHRMLLEGIYRALGVEEVLPVLRAVDKRAKVGDDGVADALAALGISDPAIRTILAAAAIEAVDSETLVAQVDALGLSHPLIDQGVDALAQVLQMGGEGVRAALHIARGLDYYTGTVVEGYLVGHESVGAVCSGGRYDDLASSIGGGPRLPGMGVSIGITRLLGYLFGTGQLRAARRSPCQVMVLLPDEARRPACDAVAERLRARGVATEVYHRKAGWGKQMKRATQLGIRYAWFPSDGDEGHRVKDLETGEQVAADLDTWEPAPGSDALPLDLEGTRIHWPPSD